MLQRVVRLVGSAVEASSIIVVAAEGQPLPTLENDITVVRDEHPQLGPLEGLAAGLRHCRFVDAVYVTSCDVPLLNPRFVDRLFDLLGEVDVVIPRDEQHYHSLAAVYRPSVLPAIHELLEEKHLRMRDLFEKVRTREISTNDLRDVDPELLTLQNVNSQADYAHALFVAGIANAGA